MDLQKTKIVCTIGPSSESPEMLRRLIDNGMSLARLNFAHGTHERHREKMDAIRAASDQLKKPIAILQDLCGPKIRVGKIPGKGIHLIPGELLVLTSEKGVASANRVSITYPELTKEVKKGDKLLLADGFMEVCVEEATETEIVCRVIIGGVLTSNKGINLPTGTIHGPALTPKDEVDLRFGLQCGVDYVAMSFVRSAEDIDRVREIITAEGKTTPIIAKIEKHEAVGNIDEIIATADAIMVARGDLGVEIPLEEAPEVQKMLVRKANRAGKPVIVATQMLRSMVDAPRPTRAEATDVANAVLDGADAVMLSEETAAGQYPAEAVAIMSRIIRRTEGNYPYSQHLDIEPGKSIPQSVAHAACVLSEHLNAAAIIAPTFSGFTAMTLSRYRPRRMILALSPNIQTVRRLALYWGCMPALMERVKHTDALIEASTRAALASGHVSSGDIAIITSGHPLWVSGTTTMIRVKEL